jgi:hypothetical protein
MPRVRVLLLKNSMFYNTTGPFFVQFTHKTPNKSTQQSNNAIGITLQLKKLGITLYYLDHFSPHWGLHTPRALLPNSAAAGAT